MEFKDEDIKRDRDYYLKLICEYEGSNLSKQDFCRIKGISKSTLYKYQKIQKGNVKEVVGANQFRELMGIYKTDSKISLFFKELKIECCIRDLSEVISVLGSVLNVFDTSKN